MKFNKFKKSTRFLAITIALLTLALSLPITAFAADDVEPQYSIIHTPDGGTMSVDPNVVKVDEISGYLFEDPLGSSRSAVERMERSSVTVENMGSFAVSEYDDFWMQTPPQAASTVTWSVSNSYLASVDSSGTVYVTTAGAFYLNALFFDSNGKAWCYRYHFVIEVSNGVYKFKNKANNMYIELPAGNIAEGTEYILWQEESNRNSEFKITDVGAGVYTIRSMVANHVGMSKSSDDRLVNSFVDTGPDTDLNNEAYIVDEDLWGIASSSQGYYIYNITGGVAGNYTITPQIDEEPPTFALSYFNQSTSQYWSFISVAPNKHGVEIRNSTDTLAVGDTFQFTATMYSSYFNVHGQHGITWSITSGDSYASINPSTGVLTAVSPGSVTVTATYTYRTNISWSDDYEVYVYPLPEGVYFVKNSLLDKYIQPDDAYANNNYSTSQIAIETHEFDGGNYQKWNFIYVGDGYYKIISEASGQALAIQSTGVDIVDGLVIQESYFGSTRQQWKIVPVDSANQRYKIKPRSSEPYSTDLCMCADSTSVRVDQNTYNNDSNYIDEWKIIGNIDYLLLYPGDFYSNININDVLNAAEEDLQNNANMYGKSERSLDKAEVLVGLSTSKIFSFIGHGTKESIDISSNSNSNVNITVQDIASLNENALNGLDFVYYGACEAGKGRESTSNLANATYNKGAKAVLSFVNEMHIDLINIWSEYLIEGISLGMTPEDAIDYADDCCAESGSRYEHYSSFVNDDSVKPTILSNRYFIRRN